MVGQMVTDVPLSTEPQREAMAQMMTDHLKVIRLAMPPMMPAKNAFAPVKDDQTRNLNS